MLKDGAGSLDVPFTRVENENGDGELFVLETDEEYDMINEVIDQFYEDQLQNADEE